MRDVRLFDFINDIDFSKNGAIKNFCKTQGEHWQKYLYTLFMSVTWFLLSEEWNKEEGKLPKDAEVTVDGEMAGKEVNLNSFWGQVVEVCSDGTYKVKDESGNIHVCERKRLRH